MAKSRALVRSMQDLVDHAVSADAALEFVRTSHKQGGGLRLVGSALLLFVALMSALVAFGHPRMALVAVGALVPLVRLLKQGLRSSEVAFQIDRARRLRQPLSAALVDRVLLLGTANTPLEQWCAIPVTPDQELHIRGLALPAARIHREREDDG